MLLKLSSKYMCVVKSTALITCRRETTIFYIIVVPSCSGAFLTELAGRWCMRAVTPRWVTQGMPSSTWEWLTSPRPRRRTWPTASCRRWRRTGRPGCSAPYPWGCRSRWPCSPPCWPSSSPTATSTTSTTNSPTTNTAQGEMAAIILSEGCEKKLRRGKYSLGIKMCRILYSFSMGSLSLDLLLISKKSHVFVFV